MSIYSMSRLHMGTFSVASLWDGPYVRSYGTAAACDLR